MRISLLATPLFILLTLNAWAQEMGRWGFPDFQSSSQFLYFGNNIPGSDGAEKLHAYLSSRPISNVEHVYTQSVPSVLVSTVKFAQSREKLVVRARRSLDGTWQLEEVKGVKYQLADFVPPMPSASTVINLLLLTGGILFSRKLFGSKTAPPGEEKLVQLTVAEEAAVLFVSLPPETSASMIEKMSKQEVGEQVAAITALPNLNSITRFAVLGKAAALLGCLVCEVERVAADSPEKVRALINAWREAATDPITG